MNHVMMLITMSLKCVFMFAGRMPVWELLLIIFSGLAALVLLAGWFLRPLMQRMHKREGLLADLIAAKEGDNINGRYHAMEESDEFGVGAASSGGADIEVCSNSSCQDVPTNVYNVRFCFGTCPCMLCCDCKSVDLIMLTHSGQSYVRRRDCCTDHSPIL